MWRQNSEQQRVIGVEAQFGIFNLPPTRGHSHFNLQSNSNLYVVPPCSITGWPPMILCSSEAQTQALWRRRTAAVGGSESSCPFEPRRKQSAGMKAEERERKKIQKNRTKILFICVSAEPESEKKLRRGIHVMLQVVVLFFSRSFRWNIWCWASQPLTQTKSVSVHNNLV